MDDPYASIAAFYDAWSRSVTEDIPFYVEQALASGGPVVELGVGTGRIAVPIARAGVRVLGIDASEAMLRVAEATARAAGVSELLELRRGDLRDPPVDERVPLVICPFRSLLHLETEAEKLRALRAARDLLEPQGRFVFDVFRPSAEDIAETDGRWLEREPEIFERADWEERTQTLELSVRCGDEEAHFRLHWLAHADWLRLLEEAGFEVEATYGWFDLRPYVDEEDIVFACRRVERRSDR